MKASLLSLFERDIDRLHAEISAYEDESKLWLVADGISNSAGNLCLHLVGNLNHFIGAILGNSGYVRQRDLEFSTKDVPQQTLLHQITEVKTVVANTLKSLTDEQLKAVYPLEPLGYAMSTDYFLIHLSGHLNYHLGQINYHRRLLEHRAI